MPHELKKNQESIELSVTAPTREELFRDALAGVLEASYGIPFPDGTYDGRVVPVQAAGGDDDVLLEDLVEDALRAVQDEPGTLHPPRWLAFDEKRVTANLPVHTPKTKALALEIASAEVAAIEGGMKARLDLLLPITG